MKEYLKIKTAEFSSIVENQANSLVAEAKKDATTFEEVISCLKRVKYLCEPFKGNEDSRFYITVVNRAFELVKEEINEAKFIKEEK